MRILFFTNGIKRHICEANNLQLGHDLHISVNDIVNQHYTWILFHTCEVSGK